ncbi:MAG: nucleotidyltransferase domain-containing protein [Chloroflexi bacterium]|nr:nucleotidyltransferase domain-containing protein [Chloroflexota bacterium]
METTVRDPALRELAEVLKRELGDDLDSVILFGSRARGDFDEDSDYDVVALVKEQSPELEARIRRLKNEIDWKYDVMISIFVYERSYFDRKKYEPLFINIRREGVPL